MSARDDDFAARLADLEAAIDELREELRASGPRRTRPPTPRELLRITERYTIPTIIALLEATVRSLELLQRLIRLSDSERALREGSPPTRSRMARTRSDAMEGVSRTLSELQRALSATDLPADRSSREVLELARELTEEIDARIAEAADEDRTRREGYRTEDASRGAISIDVVEEGEQADDERERAGGERTGDERTGGNHVDVEAELASIKDRLGVDADARTTGDPGGDDLGSGGGSDGPSGEADDTDDDTSSDGDDRARAEDER